MHARRLAATLALMALLPGCAAVVSSNEPVRGPLIERIQHGMTRDEVRALLGPPDEVMPFPLSATVAWDYRYADAWGYQAMFAVTFGVDGRVVSMGSRRINDGRSGSGMN